MHGKVKHGVVNALDNVVLRGVNAAGRLLFRPEYQVTSVTNIGHAQVLVRVQYKCLGVLEHIGVERVW